MNYTTTQKELLEKYADLSYRCGSSSAYVQGGGGNTSVKLDDTYMAVKASGFCLKDITENSGYVVLDYSRIRGFYADKTGPATDALVAEGEALTRAVVVPEFSELSLRPSVEAGFHSILSRFVAHTHSVYANLATCSKDMVSIVRQAFDDADYAWGVVPYSNPGVQLTLAIQEEQRRVQEAQGVTPSVFFMQNHGVVCQSDDADTCVRLHEDVNRRMAAYFGLDGNAFPEIVIHPVEDGLYETDIPYLSELLRSGRYTPEFLAKNPLYPDQLVFLENGFFMDLPTVEPNQCVADSRTGCVRMRMGKDKAQVTAETLTAVLFIQEHIRQSGHEVAFLNDAAKTFISNWESEKYRKSIVK